MSAHILSNLLNELGKRDKMRRLPSLLSLFATSLMNSIIPEHEWVCLRFVIVLFPDHTHLLFLVLGHLY